MFILFLRIIIGMLFIFSGSIKLLDLHSFLEAIQNFKILPNSLTALASLTIPSLEIICGLSLSLNLFNKTSTYTLFSVMIIFSFAIIFALAKGMHFECNCFGPIAITSGISIKSLLVNSLIILCLSILIKNYNEHFTFSFRDVKSLGICIIFLSFIFNVF